MRWSKNQSVNHVKRSSLLTANCPRVNVTHTEFIQMVSRGGLQSLSDILLMICKFVYTVFLNLQRCSMWFDFLRLKNPASALASLCLRNIRESPYDYILDMSCENEHLFATFFSRCVVTFLTSWQRIMSIPCPSPNPQK